MSLDRGGVFVCVYECESWAPFCFEHLLSQPMGRACVCVYLCLCTYKCVHIMQLLQADGGVVQNNPNKLMEKMNPTIHSPPRGQKQERGKAISHLRG